MEIKYAVSALNDIGRKRKSNDDAILINRKYHFFGVSDGVGSFPYGKQCAHLVCQEIDNVLKRAYQIYEEEHDIASLKHFMKQSIENISDKISILYNDGVHKYYGATFCGVMFIANKALFFNIGDSRAYHLKRYSNEIKQVSKDHTIASILLEKELITLKDYQTNYQSSPITHYMGMNEQAEVDVFEKTLHKNERIILASDGLFSMVSNEEIRQISAKSNNPKRVVKKLVKKANENGGKDNISVIYLKIK